MKRRLRTWFVMPGLWGILGVVLHGIWIFTVLAVLSNADFGLHERLTSWVKAHRGPNQGGPAYMIAYGYILNGVAAVIAIAVACNVLWIALSIRQGRIEQRIKRGLCPKCAYDLRGTQASVCPECGATR